MGLTEDILLECVEQFRKSSFKSENSTDICGEGEDFNSITVEDKIKCAAAKAYGDIQIRTVKGAGDIPELKEKSIEKLCDIINNYLDGSVPDNQDTFDYKHCEMCKEFLVFYNGKLNQSKKTQAQKFGKAQKVINMALKYLYCLRDFGKDKIKREWFEYAHMPLDSYILEWYKTVKKAEISWKNESWSGMSKVAYDKIQEDIRGTLKDGIKYKYGDNTITLPTKPLEAEFIIWPMMKYINNCKALKSAMRIMREDFEGYSELKGLFDYVPTSNEFVSVSKDVKFLESKIEIPKGEN